MPHCICPPAGLTAVVDLPALPAPHPGQAGGDGAAVRAGSGPRPHHLLHHHLLLRLLRHGDHLLPLLLPLLCPSSNSDDVEVYPGLLSCVLVSSVEISRQAGAAALVNVQTVGEVEEGVVGDVPPGPLHHHPDADDDALESVPLQSGAGLAAADEADEAGLDVVVLNPGRAAVLDLPDEVAVVEVVPLHDHLTLPADEHRAVVELQPGVRHGVVHDVHHGVLVEHQV